MCLLALRRVLAAAADRDEFIVTESANGGWMDGARASRSQLFQQTDVFGVGGCLRQNLSRPIKIIHSLMFHDKSLEFFLVFEASVCGSWESCIWKHNRDVHLVFN